MNKFMSLLEKNLLPIANKIANQRHLSALRDAMVSTIPFIIIGSIFLILASFPIPAYMDFLNNHPKVQSALLYPFDATFNLIGLIAIFSLGYKLAESYKVDPLASGLVAISSYFLVTPTDSYEVKDSVVNAFNVDYLSAQGLFVGLIVAVLSTEVYRLIIQRNLTIKMPEGVPPTVAKSFTTVIPGFFVVLVMWTIRLLIENLTHMGNIHTIINHLIQQPITILGTSLLGTIIVFFVINLLWTIGLHGSIIANAVMMPIWLNLTSANAAALANGMQPEHIATAEFRYIIFIGGSGSTLGLVIAMTFLAKSQQMKKLGKLGIGPSLFGINEPILFGFPIVFNPIMWIPFLITPIVTVLITYISMDIGLVAKPLGILPPNTTPPLLNSYLMTGSLSTVILQLILFILTFLIYFPFFKLVDNQRFKEENQQ